MSKLYLVPTPVGNLEDITLRALRVLKEVDFILAEDTRTTSFLLKHFEISKPLQSFHIHNEHKALEGIVQKIASGSVCALCSDAGTPAISDPGFLLVRECILNGIEVDCLPGATALIPALVNSGLPANSFCFEGFLPQKKGRQTKLISLQEESRTMIFYESPFRVLKALEEFKIYFGADRKCSISREISKKFEETVRGTVEELIEHFTKNTPRGEFVIVLNGKSQE